MSEVKKLPEGVTEADLAKMKAKGKVYRIAVEKDGTVHVGLFKKPDLTIMGAAASKGTNDPLEAGRVLYQNCKLKVDPGMDSDDEVKLGAINAVAKLFRILEAEVGEA